MSLLWTHIKQLSKIPLKVNVAPLWKGALRLKSTHPSDFELQHKTPICVKADPIPVALYGGRHTATMLPGGGIGPELMQYVLKIFKYMGAPVDFEVIEIDPNSNDNEDLEYALMSIQRNGVAIKGNIETISKDPDVKLRNVAVRTHLDLFVYVLWCKNYPGIPAKHKNVDIVVIRQNTEGEYQMLEHSISGIKVVENLKIVTRENSLRLATYAFEYARKHKRKKVTTVHKASLMQLSDGLFLNTAREVAKQYPEIEHNDVSIDYCCRQLVAHPNRYDVILTTNLYGNILANVICGLAGGPGLVSGKNYGDHYAVFEPGTRNTGTGIVGKDVANPVAMLNAACDMLRHLGSHIHATRLENAIYKTICEDRILTRDVGGNAKTSDVVQKILDHLEDSIANK